MEQVLEAPATEVRATSYWRETKHPIYSAALVLPFIVVYEAGLILTRSNVINGGDAILLTLGGRLFQLAGMQASFVSAAALLVYFLLWQIKRRGPWKIEFDRLVWMFLESLLYAVILFQLLGFFVQYLPRERRGADVRVTMEARAPVSGRTAGVPSAGRVAGETPAAQAIQAMPKPGVLDFVLYCGAGVYEELVFRALLMGLLVLVCTKLFHMEHAYAAVWAVLAGAIIFAAFHHIGGEPFTWGAFLQRGFAGLYFSAIYFNRCFGVAAASHALYDILVGLHMWRM